MYEQKRPRNDKIKIKGIGCDGVDLIRLSEDTVSVPSSSEYGNKQK
jgi:hypothetical protein